MALANLPALTFACRVVPLALLRCIRRVNAQRDLIRFVLTTAPLASLLTVPQTVLLLLH